MWGPSLIRFRASAASNTEPREKHEGSWASRLVTTR
jgi:hypothetical protein